MPNRILLAEDDRATRESLVRALELEGYQVHAVGDGSGVLDAGGLERPDVIVLDLMMPHVGGLTVCRRLRAAGDRTPILIVTARTEVSGLVDELVALAVDRYDDEPEQTVALEELAERAADRARRRSGRTIDVDGEPTEVIGKPHQLLRAVGNLLDNALKFSPDATPVEVTVRGGPAGGRLTVRDHGAGISQDDLPHVFERFYRALDARGLPGSGLGLAIVQQIVEGCDGTVQAANHPDGGTVFTVELPAAAEAAEPMD